MAEGPDQNSGQGPLCWGLLGLGLMLGLSDLTLGHPFAEKRHDALTVGEPHHWPRLFFG